MKPTLLSSWLLVVLLTLRLTSPGQSQAQPAAPCETVVTCPADLFLTTQGEGVNANFSITATNPCTSNFNIRCNLGAPDGPRITSLTLYPPGTNIVYCTVSSDAGDPVSCSFNVVVQQDFEPPQIVMPPRIIVPCDGPQGAVVEFSAGAFDNFDPDPAVTSDPPSGSLFRVGTSLVTCTAVDAAGNRSIREFSVIVGSGCGVNRCIQLAVPDDLVVPCTDPAGAVVTFAATARDLCTGGDLPVTCTPPSGSVFPVGITRVICNIDADPLQASAAFLVEVTDTAPPVLECPSNIVVAALSPLGAVVEYEVTAQDDCSPQTRVRCSPASGEVFPVGDTRVLCEAADDSGNISQCVFVVTVLPPRPFTVSHAGPDGLELRWTGEAVVESTDTLGENAVWFIMRVIPDQEGDEWVLRLPASERSQFFRLNHRPVVPPPDRDRDGIPDADDRCPDSPPGAPVDETGCGMFDLVASPDLVLGPEEARLRRLRTEMRRWPGTEGLSDLVPVAEEGRAGLQRLMFERDFKRALAEAMVKVRGLETALTELVQARIIRLREMESTAPILEAENADMRNEDHELLDFELFEEALTESLWRHQKLTVDLTDIVRSIEETQTTERVQIQSLDSARGIAVLTDGRQLLLPRPKTTGAPALDTIVDALAEGQLVDVTRSALPDGSNYAVEVMATEGVSGLVVAQVNPSRLSLRVTPADFGLPNFDLAERHQLKAFKWGFTDNLSRHYLEYQQAFTAIKLLSLGSGGNYKHWLKIDVDLNNDGFYGTLVQKMDETTPPFVLKQADLPEFQPFSVRVREYRAPVVGTGLGPSEVLNEEFYAVEINQTGFYAEAFYDQTSFDLQDSPSETGHRVARVTDIARRFPLTLQPANETTFSGASFKATGNSSSYPGVHSIGLNDPFAVHFQDPNDSLFFANPNDYDKGIYQPSLRGYRNGALYRYRVSLPFIARDRLHNCSGSQPDTFYKIPLSSAYSVSQGNNGQFTHNGWQRFAWDFPKAANTTVLAARGGRVDSMRESSSQSCWNPNAANPDGTTGACQNCMGSASANFVFIRHRDGTYAWYGHFRNNQVFVNVNQRVYRGTALGGVGTTGCSTGNHLHFHVVNPEQTATIPIRFESYTLPFFQFEPCYLPPSSSIGLSTQ